MKATQLIKELQDIVDKEQSDFEVKIMGWNDHAGKLNGVYINSDYIFGKHILLTH